MIASYNIDSGLSVSTGCTFVVTFVHVNSYTGEGLKPFVLDGVNQLILVNQSVSNNEETAHDDPIESISAR